MGSISNDIAVSIAMISYNHEKYIKQALDSVLMQKVTFKYEIVIGDDCSKDNTQGIIKIYQEKYPDIIKAILRSQNIGVRKNADDVKSKCKGKYMIFLEGDDYWTDSNKLQIQYEFLEKNPQYVAIAHWCDIVDEDGKISNKYKHKCFIFNFNKINYRMRDYKKGRIPGHVNTIMHRNFFLNHECDYMKLYSASESVGDRTLYLILVEIGNVYVLPRIMSCYRYISKTGEKNYSSVVKGKNMSLEWYNYYLNLEKLCKEIFKKNISLKKLRFSTFLSSLSIAIKIPTMKNKEIVKSIYYKINKFELFFYMPIAILIRIVDYITLKMSH